MQIRFKTLALIAIVLLSAKSEAEAYKPLYKQSIEDIAQKYTFVGDFSIQPAEREISDEIFWSYPYKISKPTFPIITSVDNIENELTATKGKGRSIEHINRGRAHFLNKQYDEARKAWLAARATYGTNWPEHRRNDYFISLAFLQLAKANLDTHKDYAKEEVKGLFDNTTTFLSWAFIRKEDIPDPLLDSIAPKQLYNLAAIYWQYGRFAGAYGAAEKGLNFLRKTGRTDYRAEFLRISAEAHIQNKTYLEAVQLLDMVIRYDIENVVAYEKERKKGTKIDPKKEDAYKKSVEQVSAAFARIGDIYFDLRNYELAEDAYGLAARIDEEANHVSSEQLILRGESLFWLGRFSESQKALHFALDRRGSGGNNIPRDMAAWASLRHADAALAQAKSEKDFNATRLAYYKVWHSFGESDQSNVANIRAACLELPEYKGNNVGHARELIEKSKLSGATPYVLKEYAWSCQVASYTDRERTPEMLERVRTFANNYPESRFLKQFADPVRDVQAERINAFLKNKDYFSAASFFEKNRENLFPKVSSELQVSMFDVYANIGNFKKAGEFWNAYEKAAETDMDFMRKIAVASEQAEDKDQKESKVWAKRRDALIKDAEKKKWRLFPDTQAMTMFNRIAATKATDRHLFWMKNLAEYWSNEKPDYVCDVEYPILSRIADLNQSGVNKVTARLNQMVSTYLPDLFTKDESCGLSLLELENKIYAGQTEELAKKYLDRKEWPLIGGFLHLYWMVAEHLNEAGDRSSAGKLLKVIAEKGPQGAPETGFAKARLDPTKTEVEKLWD
jgi:tetratricopeptide (TPR) repeat protein